MTFRLLFLCVWLSGSMLLTARTFYVNPAGNNIANGLTINSAWHSISKINTTAFSSGDTILFEGGSAFKGNIYLGPESFGTPRNPIVISSYGSGKAIITAGNGDGFFAHNTSGIELKNLIFKGSGNALNYGTGVYFYIDKIGNSRFRHIVIENIETSDFGIAGIRMGSAPTDQSRSGFDSVVIKNCIAHDNGINGISIYGNSNITDTLYAHKHIRITKCIAYNNYGISGMFSPSGNGIIVGQVDSGVIEYCEAYANGKNNNYLRGGPAGIKASDSRNLLIQYCYSHHNRSQTIDGNGFEMENGMQHSIMQYNYSHDNDGQGFLISQNTGARKMIRNAVRYSISERDGKGSGVLIRCGDPAGIVTVEKIHFYNNTIFIDTTGNNTVNAAIAVKNNYGAMRDIMICNNIFITKNNAALIDIQPTINLKFYNNAYFDNGDGYKFIDNGKVYYSLVIWRSINGQEFYNGKSTGFKTDPQLLNAGAGNKIGGADSLQNLSAYRLKNTSLLIGRGIVIDSLFGFKNIITDFFGDTVVLNHQYSPGAHEIDAPEAQFSVSSGCKGTVTKFINRSLKANTYLWKFGDGSFSDEFSPSHLYMNGGSHTVTLIISGKFGYIDSIKKTFEIHDAPHADFTINAGNTCPGSTITFTNQSKGTGSYLWQFDDSTSDNKQHTTHSFISAQIHHVKLIASSGKGCQDSVIKQIEIFPKPDAGFTVKNLCMDDSTLFICSGKNEILFDWAFSDTSFSTIQNPYHLFKYPGKHIITLIAGTHQDCRDTLIQLIEIHKKPIAAFKIKNHCFGDTIPLANLSKGDSLSFWDFGEGTTSIARTPVKICKRAGIVSVKLKVISANNCFHTTENPVEVFDLPSAQFTYVKKDNVFYFTANDTFLNSYEWFINNNPVNSKHSGLTVKFTGNSPQKILLKTGNINKCMDTFSVSIDNSLLIKNELMMDPLCKVYPNPFTDKLTIAYNSETCDSIDFEIKDIQGKEIYKMIYTVNKSGNGMFHLDPLQFPLQNGIYILTVHTGKSVFSTRLVKE